MTSKHIRCAIYTRKSSEEGLEQSFNSLEAQREACRSFILSQKHEGWTALNAQYDDGGFSGGTMERPALQQILSDIEANKIDAVVVYKVDRLTRSLGDFSKIIDVFDSHAVSFVSVTQQFNTTTSMGRLTLNVLLSFAQFEREVTGERIRDKIAASKKKGMWMGGVVPLGYDCVDQRLIVSGKEANTVRQIFREYLRLGCVKKLKQFLDENQIRSKVRKSQEGRTSGGAPFSRGALYHLLNNRIYIGEINHRKQIYPGQHEPIISRPMWDQVSARLLANNQGRRDRKTPSIQSLLTGKVFDTDGVRLTPTHSVKNSKRYRYYTSQAAIKNPKTDALITRLPARELEQFVRREFLASFQAPERYAAGIRDHSTRDSITDRGRRLAREWTTLGSFKQDKLIRNVLHRVVVGGAAVSIQIDRLKLATILLGQTPGKAVTRAVRSKDAVTLTKPFQIIRQGNETRILASVDGSSSHGVPIPSLLKAVARANNWYEQIVSGKITAMEQIPRLTGLGRSYILRILQCANLSPQIIEALLLGKHRPNLTLNELLSHPPLDWNSQQTGLRLI